MGQRVDFFDEFSGDHRRAPSGERFAYTTTYLVRNGQAVWAATIRGPDSSAARMLKGRLALPSSDGDTLRERVRARVCQAIDTGAPGEGLALVARRDARLAAWRMTG